MQFLKHSLKQIQQASLALAMIFAVLLFFVVAFNIVARLIFDLTNGAINLLLLGAIELSQYTLMIFIFAAIPATLSSGLIRVDIVSQKFSQSLQSALSRLWYACIALFALILVSRFYEQAATTFSRGDVTQDLQLPLWIFYAIAALECVALAILSSAFCVGLLAQQENEDNSLEIESL